MSEDCEVWSVECGLWKVELIEQGVKDYLLPLSRWKPMEEDGSHS